MALTETTHRVGRRGQGVSAQLVGGTEEPSQVEALSGQKRASQTLPIVQPFCVQTPYPVVHCARSYNFIGQPSG